MTKPTTLAEQFELRQCELASKPLARPAIQSRRDFMAGALAAMELLTYGRSESDLCGELAQYGRAIGTAAEAAT